MLPSLSPLSLIDPPTLPSSQTTESDPLFFHSSEAVSLLNLCLADIGETPFSQSRAYSQRPTADRR